MADLESDIPVGLGSYLATTKALNAQGDQARNRALENEFLQRRQALGQNPSMEDLTNLGMQFSGPEALVRYGQASQDRQAAIKQRADAVDKMFDYHIKSIQANIDNTLARIKDAESARMLKDQWEREKNDLLRQKNDILLELGVARTQAQNKPPSGYRPTAEGNLEAIPGGPADVKAQGVFNQDTASLNAFTSEMDRLGAAAAKLKAHSGLAGITGMRGVLPNIPGGDSAGAQALLNSIEPQVAFGVLQDMRNNSKSGGALGQVSNQEEQMLKNALVPLGRAQSYEDFKTALGDLVKYTESAKERVRASYNMKHGPKTEGTTNIPSASAIDEEIRKRRERGRP